MRRSVEALFSYQLFGMAFSGADVCGFEGNFTSELCGRWYQLGAFFPFVRNHYGAGAEA